MDEQQARRLVMAYAVSEERRREARIDLLRALLYFVILTGGFVLIEAFPVRQGAGTGELFPAGLLGFVLGMAHLGYALGLRHTVSRIRDGSIFKTKSPEDVIALAQEIPGLMELLRSGPTWRILLLGQKRRLILTGLTLAVFFLLRNSVA